MLVILAILFQFLTYQNTMFRSIDKISDIIAKSKSTSSRDQQFLYEGQDSNLVSSSLSSPIFYCTRLFFLSLGLLLSIKLPQTIDLILQIMGGLAGTILTILFPILIFHKSFKNTGKYGYVLVVNWVLFAVSIGVGGLGIYEGVTHIKNMEVLLVIN